MMTTEYTSMIKFLAAGLLIASVLLSATACGKRGDPYRPSEIPTSTTSDQ
jgi:predicted small lipoprotein YifL